MNLFSATFALLLTASFISCQNDQPSDVLPKSKMQSLLYDYALAKAMGASHKDSTMFYSEYYVALALKKHNVTRAQMDSSLAYYCTRAEDLHEIYLNIGKRMERGFVGQEARVKRLGSRDNSQGSRVKGEGSSKPHDLMTDASGDTLYLWQGPGAFMLHSTLNTHVEFTQTITDSVINRGDELRLTFTPVQICRSSDKGQESAVQHSPAEGYAVLAMKFASDTTVTVKHRFFMSGRQDLSTTVPLDNLKEVRGFFYQSSRTDGPPPVLFIMRPVMLRFRGDSSTPTTAPTAPAHSSLPPPVGGNASSHGQGATLENVPLSKFQEGVEGASTDQVNSKPSVPQPPSAAAQKRVRDSLIREDRNRGRRAPL